MPHGCQPGAVPVDIGCQKITEKAKGQEPGKEGKNQGTAEEESSGDLHPQLPLAVFGRDGEGERQKKDGKEHTGCSGGGIHNVVVILDQGEPQHHGCAKQKLLFGRRREGLFPHTGQK